MQIENFEQVKKLMDTLEDLEIKIREISAPKCDLCIRNEMGYTLYRFDDEAGKAHIQTIIQMKTAELENIKTQIKLL